jgi:ATP-dependent Clp protease adaptor protein ClpS
MAAPERVASPSRARPTAPAVEPATGDAQTDFDVDTLRRLLPPHKVVVHNNDFNTFEEVTKILLKAVPGISFTEAVAYTEEIHNTGAAVPYTGPKEQAEAVAAVIRTIGIKVTIERDG